MANHEGNQDISFTHNGVTKTIAEWSKITGINKHTIWSRINRGTAHDKILSTSDCRSTRSSKSFHRKDGVQIEYKGKIWYLFELARELGVKPATLRYRARNGWDAASIVETQIKQSVSHGGLSEKYAREFTSWKGMLERCYDKDFRYHHYYGGRGISVCERWRNSFVNFINDMGSKPTPKHTLDRYPNMNGNYEPENCRWATAKEQQRNTRKNKFITYKGETHCISEWAELYGLRTGTLWNRLKSGWSMGKAIHTPLGVMYGPDKNIIKTLEE